MGYTVDYKYYQEKSKGEYNRDEALAGSIKVGSPYEDISLDVLAGKVMALMARRNILVFDVEVYEIAKKPLSFKETDDGIVIKNKKFRFDDGPAISSSETVSEDTMTMLKRLVDEQPNLIAMLTPKLATAAGQENLPAVQPSSQLASLEDKRPLRYEVFDPEPWVVESNFGNVKSMKFTRGKKYPIYDEKLGHMRGVIYTTVDDDMKRQNVLDKYFVAKVQLTDEGVGKREGLTDTGLSWGGVLKEDGMPKLR